MAVVTVGDVRKLLEPYPGEREIDLNIVTNIVSSAPQGPVCTSVTIGSRPPAPLNDPITPSRPLLTTVLLTRMALASYPDSQLVDLDVLRRIIQQATHHMADKNLDSLKERYAGLISKFYEVCERKVSLLDDYGDEQWSSLEKELDLVIQKIATKEEHTDFHQWRKYPSKAPEEYQRLSAFLRESFKERHEREKALPTEEVDYSRMSGVEFEAHLIKLLRRNGFTDIRGTPASGDQGADLLAKKDGRTIIIQAKRHEAPVGNKPVQEVASAVRFYSGDEGWVITNSTFTKSARELAQRTGVKLIEGFDLEHLSKFR